jgi:methylamine dehydrogenase heavy chain
VRGGFGSDGTYIVNSATGKLGGADQHQRLFRSGDRPGGQAYYVGETIWSRGNRGTRQDIVSVYDSKTLKLETEIPVPGRLIIGAQSNDFVLSQDGKTGYLFNLTPATSVNIVDMVKRKFVKNVDLPGCAGLMPINEGLVALCSDGSMATLNLTGGKAEITRGFFLQALGRSGV